MIRIIEKYILLGIIAGINVLILITIVATVLRYSDVSNTLVNWLTRNIAIDTNWVGFAKEHSNKYEDEKDFIEYYSEFTNGMRRTVEDICVQAFPKKKYIQIAAELYKHNIIGMDLSDVEEMVTPSQCAQEAVQYIINLNDYLAARKIDFVYVNIPLRENSVDSDITKNFTELMKGSTIDYIDIGDTDLYSQLEFDASKHWMPSNALTFTKILVEHLESKELLEYSEDLFDVNRYHNVILDEPIIEAAISNEFGYDYEMFVPINDVTYNITINDQEFLEGGFEDVFLRNKSEWDKRTGDSGREPIAYHNMFVATNSRFIDIKNMGKDCRKKKVLILGDSFAWPVVSYLSETVQEVLYCHPRYFDGSVRKFIDLNTPDVVIMIYQENQIGKDNKLNFGCLE